jgi:hypothetical protein
VAGSKTRVVETDAEDGRLAAARGVELHADCVQLSVHRRSGSEQEL